MKPILTILQGTSSLLPTRALLACVLAAALTPWLAGTAASTDDAGDVTARRAAMLEQIRAYGAAGGPAIGDRVLAAMAKVPRHELVASDQRELAYADTPLPIGGGQTISQPYIVALMTELAAVDPGEKVLEVGTGSGYQAAVLAEMGARVYTIEIVEALGIEAARRLKALGYADRITTRIGDGYAGWPEHAPFDAIVVTAAPEEVPPPLIEQLAPGGRLVIPLGTSPLGQQLSVLEKAADGAVTRKAIVAVSFVPLTRGR